LAVRVANDAEARAVDDVLQDLGHPRPLNRVITIVSHPTTSELSRDWEEAFLLCEREIRTGPKISLGRDGMKWAWSYAQHELGLTMDDADLGMLPVHVLGESDRIALLDLHGRLVKNRSALPELPRALQALSSLRAIPTHSPLRCLGYFTVIESLLTSKPRATDQTDSLSRQVNGKMNLVGRRCSPPIVFDEHFRSPPKDIWKRLYDYRSDVAHGSEPDFSRALACLEGQEPIERFLRVVTRRLLRYALTEPDLVGDLKAC
jgi:hypothetical protein